MQNSCFDSYLSCCSDVIISRQSVTSRTTTKRLNHCESYLSKTRSHKNRNQTSLKSEWYCWLCLANIKLKHWFHFDCRRWIRIQARCSQSELTWKMTVSTTQKSIQWYSQESKLHWQIPTSSKMLEWLSKASCWR